MMKRIASCLLLAAAVLALVAPRASAQQRRPFQLSLVTPIQIFPDTFAIGGLRINLLYGRNAAVMGLDIGLVNHTTTHQSTAVQFGAVGLSDAPFRGWQNNIVNVVQARFEGFQQGVVNYNQRGEGFFWGVVNFSDDSEGFQLGIVNRAKKMSGFQLGFVNFTENMNGLQIGFLNIITKKKGLPVLPIVNWNF